MGASDILEAFTIYGQNSSSIGYSLEQSKILVNFPIDTISSDRSLGYIPVSGSVYFYLKMFNAIHSSTTPTDFVMTAAPISSSWTEGYGLDMDEYTDLGVSNWIKKDASTNWLEEGGDFLSGSSDFTSSQVFTTGIENLEVDVTSQVEEWMAGNTGSYGFGVYMTSSILAETRSYYTKKFFGRDSEFELWRPHLEARWNSQVQDDRGNFFISSSLLSSENVNTVYLYNYKKGKATNIPGVATGPIYLKLYETLGGPESSMPVAGGVDAGNLFIVTGGWTETGIYSASFAYTGTASTIYDVWMDSTESVLFHTGTIYPITYAASTDTSKENYVLTVKNAKTKYFLKDRPRFKLFVRQKDWSPTIYDVASTEIETEIIEKAYYSLVRIQDSFEVVPYGTGSTEHTLLSFDKNGNYFDFDMSILEKGYMYGFKFSFDLQQDGEIEEQPYIFKFRVEE